MGIPSPGEVSSQECPQGKEGNDPKILEGFSELRGIMGFQVDTEKLHAGSQVASTHGGGKGSAMDAPKGLNLEGTDKGNGDIGNIIKVIGTEKADDGDDDEFDTDDQLPPMQIVAVDGL